LHIGDLFVRAFGNVTPSGKLIVGTSDESSAAHSSSALRRLNVPGSGLLGKFGSVNGKNKRLMFTDADGTIVSLVLKGGGAGQAFYDGSNVDLVLSGTTASSSLSIKTRGGDGKLSVRNIASDGSLRSIKAPGMDLTGALSVAGELGKVSLASLSGTIAAAGSIAALSAGGDLSGAMILAGANLGSDGKLGGSGPAADSFASATIGRVKVAGQAQGSVLAAGVSPGPDGIYLDHDDQLIGGSSSRIQSIAIKGGTDNSTRFVAGAIGKVRLPTKIDPSVDSRIETMLAHVQ
jgi:hypothetical protein